MNTRWIPRRTVLAWLGVLGLLLFPSGVPDARAATFDELTGRLTLDATSWALPFDSVSELTADLEAWIGSDDDDELSGPEVASLYVEDASGLEGVGYLRMGGDVRTITLRLASLETLFSGRRIEIRFWQRPEGTRLRATLQWVVIGDAAGADSVVLGSFRFQPTGRVTDDRWQEWTSGPVDFLAGGLVPPTTLEIRDDQPSSGSTLQTFRSDLRVALDALEILDLGPAEVVDATCNALTMDDVCGEHGVCQRGRCVDSALVYGPVVADPDLRDDYLDRYLFQFQSFEGGRMPQSLMNILIGAVETARNTDSPVRFWGSLRAALDGLRDGHGNPPQVSSGSGATNLGVCLHLGEADLLPSARAAPLVFSVNASNPVASLLRVGDVLLEIDGLPVDAWMSANRKRLSHNGDPEAFALSYAPRLIPAAISMGSTLTFARCDRTGAAPPPCTAAELDIIEIDTAAVIGESIWSRAPVAWWSDDASCDYRFGRAIDEPGVGSYGFAGYADEGPIRTLIINGLPTPYGYGAAWLDTVVEALDPPPQYLILDQRRGNGGSVWTTDYFIGLLVGEGDFDRVEVVPTFERPLDGSLWDVLDACAASSYTANCGTYYPWVLHDYSNMEAHLRGVAAGVRMAVLNGMDASGNDFIAQMMTYRSAATRLFSGAPTHGAFGPVYSLPTFLHEQWGGRMQLYDSVFVQHPGDPRVDFMTGTGVPPDEFVLQRQSDALQGVDTTIEAAKAWLLQE